MPTDEAASASTSEFAHEREIVLRSSCRVVFDALTDPAQIVRWWGDDTVYRMTDVVQSLTVGGLARYAGRFADGVQDGREFSGFGICREAVPPFLLEYTRVYPDGIPIAEKTAIRYELEPHRSGTRLRIRHSGFATETGCAMHAEGWERVVAWLERYLAHASVASDRAIAS
jgi:uncharacterized protein YndB with AHSA1/START domain